MKISEVTPEFAAEWIREDKDDSEVMNALDMIMPAAKAYIISHTALDESELDEHDDLTCAYLILIEDMYDNRSAVSVNTAANRTLDTILSMHSRNGIG